MFGSEPRDIYLREVFKTVDRSDQRKSYDIDDTVSEAVKSVHLCHFSALGDFGPEVEIVSYHWDFGDGNDSSGMYVYHEYSQAGEYIVTLTVTDHKGTTITSEHSVVVENI